MNAVWSAVIRAGVPSREMSSSWSIRNVRGFERGPGLGLALGRRERREPLAQLAIGVEQRIAELFRDPQQLLLVLVADADGDRDRDDAAVQAGPVRVDELLVARHVQDQPVAGLRADALQVTQDAERAPAQVRQGQVLLRAFAFEIADRAGSAAAGVEHLGQGRVLDHLFSTIIWMSRVVRRLMRASIVTGSVSVGRSRKRRAAPFRCSIISKIEKFSPMQCRGPAPKGR